MNWDFLIKDKDSLCVTTDSRKVTPGCVFVALKGEHFDGNLFVDQARADGAAYVIHGDHALDELQDLARAWRRHLGLPLIAITGTNGKTTTKELTAAVLSTKYHIHYTQGNYNNSLGVPLTLLQLTRAHELGIIEMGASHPGDIKELVEIAEPDYGLITNVGRAHLQGFGSFEGVQRTKAELYDYLLAKLAQTGQPAKPVIFLNSSNAYLKKMLDDSLRASCLPPDLIGTSLELHRNFIGTSCIYYAAIPMPSGTHLVGDYNAENIAAALCIGEYFGVSHDDALAAIRAYVPTNNRSQAVRTAYNDLVVDAYNANPTSMTASIQSFLSSPNGAIYSEAISNPQGCLVAQQCAFLLGAMRELGEYSHVEHQNIVNMLLEHKADKVFLVGDEYKQTTSPYPVFDNVEALHTYLEQHPLRNCRILIKGSRSNQLEKIIDVL